MIEVWKDIEGYEGLYQVSNLGSIKRLERYDTYKSGIVHHYEELILSPRINKFGYYYLDLSKDRKSHTFRVHCIVAKAFIPNPNNLPCINHKDENKLNNYIHINEDGSVDFEKSNLEWCSKAYNNTYNGIRSRAGKNIGKPLIAFDGVHKLGTYFSSETEAAKYLKKTTLGQISQCASGRAKSAYGYRWEFV